nr:copia-like retrotransposon [Tanacetum cinerariifolium]
MKFLLIVLKIFYVLDPLLAPIPVNPVATEGKEVDLNEVLELEKQRMIRTEDETLCCGHIKNSLSDRPYDVYAPITDPRKLWSALEFKYKQQEEVGAIVSKLPPSWNDISKKLINKKDDCSLDDLLKHLRIEEEAINELLMGPLLIMCKSGTLRRERNGKCHVCGDNGGHYARECKLRKSGNDDVNVVNGEIADYVARVHLDDDNFVA